MKDYIVECVYFEETDIGLIERTVAVTVRSHDDLDAIEKARKVVPCSLVWRI